MSLSTSDAVIIGAGAAGLAGGRKLSHEGLRLTIVEARHRFGGRIFTMRDAQLHSPIELGAEFVHGEPPDTLEVIRAAGLDLDWLPDNHHRSKNGQLSAIPHFWDKVAGVRRNLTSTMRRAPRDFSLAEYLERKDLELQSRLLLLNFAEGYNAADISKMSAKSLSIEEPENHNQFRLANGYDQIISWLRAGLDPARTDIRLNTVATEVRWKRGSVIMECQTAAGASLEPIHARAAIVTVPLALLKAKRLRFRPDLKDKESTVEKLEAGQVYKAVYRFREAFWQSKKFLQSHRLGPSPFEAIHFVHAEKEDVPVWWTALPSRNATLTAWAGGRKAEALLSEDEPTRIDKAMKALSKIFGVPKPRIDALLESWRSHDWRADPFSTAAYTYVGLGGVNAPQALAKPTQATLFFAGEATDAEEMGTVAGALKSGKRAAEQLLALRH